MRTFNTGRITFQYPDSWEVEKADILSNPDCIATLSKGQDNLINAVMFPTATNLEDYKLFMEDAISDDLLILLKLQVMMQLNFMQIWILLKSILIFIHMFSLKTEISISLR